jgi:hypothetical protein
VSGTDSPSPQGASRVITIHPELAAMSTVLDDVIRERISHLHEQIRPANKPSVNATFQLQLEILQSADIEKLDRSILMRKAHLKQARDVLETDRLFAELEALEWLQRQVKNCK